MKIQLSQRASQRWRPARTSVAWLRVIGLALICACAGLIWSSATASADTGHRSDAPLVTGIRSVGRTLGGTRNDLLGSHPPIGPTTPRHPRPHPAAKPVHGSAPARAHDARPSRDSAAPQSPIKKHPLIKHPLIKQPKIAAHPHRAKSRAHTDNDTDNDAGTVIGNITGAVGNTVRSTSGSVHRISSRVRSTADPVEGAGHRLRARHRSDRVPASIGGRSVGSAVHSVGSAVHSVGSTTDAVGSAVNGTAGIADAVDHPHRVGAASGDEIRRASGVLQATEDVVGSTGAVVDSAGRTVGSLGGDRSEPVDSVVDDLGAVTSVGSTTVGTLTHTITTTVTRTLGDTVTSLGTVVGTTTTDAGALLAPFISVVQPYGQDGVASELPGVQRTVAPESLPARHVALRSPHTGRTSASAPAFSITLLMTTPTGATTIQHPPGHRGTRPATMSGALLLGLGGGPVPDPGQRPQPAGEMITTLSSGANGHEHGMLRAAINSTVTELADIRGSSSAQPHATPYDPGYSPD